MPKDGTKDETNQGIRIIGRENWSGDEAKGCLVVPHLARIKGTDGLAIHVWIGIVLSLELGAVDDGVQGFSLSFEPMDIHHDKGRVNQSMLQLGNQKLIGATVNGDTGRIMVAIIDRVYGSILD